MKYLFYCPSCGRKVEISMPISEYHADGHLCDCGELLVRDPKDFGMNYNVKCGGFYAEHQSR